MSISLPMIDRIEPDKQIFKNETEIVVDGDVRPSPINMNFGEVQSEPLRGLESSISDPQGIKPTTTTTIGITTLGENKTHSGSDGEPAKKSPHKSVTFAEKVKSEQMSMILPVLAEGLEQPVRRVEKGKSTFLRMPKTKPVEIPCRYASCGCQETVPRGTILEQDHYQNCEYRPIPCLLEDVCGEVIPYHDFILHMITHFVKPEYTLTLNTRIYLWAEDFLHDQKWNPKWLCAQGNHFFVMMQRKIPGIWISWVWMLGSKEEASAYKYTLFYFKGLRSVGGTFTVHSIREPPEQIEMNKSCLLLTDQAMMSLSQIGDNVLTDFSVSIQISHNTMEGYEAALAEAEPTVTTLSPTPTPNTIPRKPSVYSMTVSRPALPQEMSKPVPPQPSEHSMSTLISELATEVSTSVLPNSSANSAELSIPTFGTLSTEVESTEGSTLGPTTSLEFSPSQDLDFVQFIPSGNFPIARMREDRPDYGFHKQMNHGDEVEEDGIALEEVLKIFTSNRALPAYDSSVSTSVGEKRSDLDEEFLYEDSLD